MIKALLTFLLIIFLTLPLFAQTLSVDTAWVRRYNGPEDSTDVPHGLSVDGSGNVYVAGWSEKPGRSYATVKYYSNGDTAWVRTYSVPEKAYNTLTAMAIDSSGNVYVTGFYVVLGSIHFVDYAYLTVKYYSNGDTAWVRRYGEGPEDKANAIAVENSGNVYVTGYGGTIKYDSSGTQVWYSSWGGGHIYLDNSANIYVVSAATAEYVTIKYYSNGDTAWVRRYDGPSNQAAYAYAMAIDSSGNVYVTGSGHVSGTYNYDYATVRYYPNGDTAWVRTYDGTGNSWDGAYAVAVDDSGNVYVTGRCAQLPDSPWNWDYVTIKYYSNGDTAWVRRYSGSGNEGDEAHAIAIDHSGYAYVTGWSTGSGTGYDYVTIKYYSNGDTAWVKRYNGPGNGWDQAYIINVDGSGSVYVTGQSTGVGTGLDYATIKYVQFLRGDVNQDKSVTVADIVYLVSYLFKHGPAPTPIQSGDANCDGKVTISDIVYLVAYLFKHGPAPCI